MMSRKSRLFGQIASVSCMIFLLAFSGLAQTDPNPDSPTPVLISENDSLRALTALPNLKSGIAGINGRNLLSIKGQGFAPNSRVTIYVTNLDLMPGEDASAFRINVEDARGVKYRFPVVSIEPVTGREWVYAMTVELRDELKFSEPPAADGDILIGVVWRGLASNRVRLALGRRGGDIKDDEGAVPTPFPLTQPVAGPDKTGGLDSPNYIGYKYSGDRTRFMEQATFGPTTVLDDRLRRIGLRTWLAEQFDAPYPTFAYPNIPLKPTNNAPADCDGDNTVTVDVPLTCYRDTYSLYPLQNWFYQEAFYGNAQLRHRVSWALSQLWVVSGVDTQQSSHMIAYHQQLSKNAFGNYRDLMTDVTLNPAMGNYLDMVRSTKNSPNENYAREILQLFNIGLFMLNQDGTLKLDASNNPIPTYDQTTINNFTKVFTGWGLCETTGTCPNRTAGSPNYKDPMLLNQTNHDVTAKTLLSYCGIGVANCTVPAISQNIPANTNGNTEIQMALDNIFNHPNVAPFVSRNLIQQMVTSDPTPAYVGRVAAAFNNNGAGVRGDMRAVIRAVLLDPEARGNVKTDANYGKLREPVQLATNILRQFDVKSADLSTQSDGYVWTNITPMGQNTFYSPTVFNYFPPDYIVPGPGLNAPEFAIMTTGTSIARANFMNTMIFNRINGGSTNAPNGTAINLAEMQALAAADTTSNRLLDTLNTRLMHGTLTAQNRSTILTAVNAVAATDPLTRAKTAIYLIATSSQYQVQR